MAAILFRPQHVNMDVITNSCPDADAGLANLC